MYVWGEGETRDEVGERVKRDGEPIEEDILRSTVQFSDEFIRHLSGHTLPYL